MPARAGAGAGETGWGASDGLTALTASSSRSATLVSGRASATTTSADLSFAVDLRSAATPVGAAGARVRPTGRGAARRVAPVSGAAAGARVLVAEIGRASCRERVCNDV